MCVYSQSTMGVNYPRASYVFGNAADYTEMEKRQLFLRSYQFSRKQGGAERIKKSLFRVKKSICVRFRSAGKLRKMMTWLNLKNGLLGFAAGRRRRFFLRLHSYHW